jgi:hypothetical protein
MTLNRNIFLNYHVVITLNITKDRVVGLSKLARVVEVFSKRLQTQERLTMQIANTLMESLDAKGVAVTIDSTHQCMTMRGIKKEQASTVTNYYLGQFKDELRHGKGTYVLASGDTYTGDWVGGERHGKGTYAHVLGEWENDIYVGEFYKNKKQGRGLYTFPDGVKYLGSFYDDLRHGSGRFIYKDGSSMEVDCVKDSCTEK